MASDFVSGFRQIGWALIASSVLASTACTTADTSQVDATNQSDSIQTHIVDDIVSPAKSVSFILEDDYVAAEGRWRVTVDTAPESVISGINTVRIICYKARQSCSERVPYVSTLSDEAYLDVLTFDYEILEWTGDDLIRAISRTAVADIELRISVADESAERSFRETPYSGSITPSVLRVWVLE